MTDYPRTHITSSILCKSRDNCSRAKGGEGVVGNQKKYNRRGKNERFSPKVVCFLDFTHRSLKIDCQKNLLLVFLTKMPVRDDNGKKCATLERFPKTELETKELQVI